jgi:putative ABC transport system permease protein
MNYMRNRDLGIDIANVICVPVDNLEEDYATLKAELRQNPNILNVTATSSPLAYYSVGTSGAEWEGKEKGQRISMGLAMVDFDTIATFKLQMAAGRPFQKEFATDATEAFIVNETAVLAMGLQDPIGKRFSWNQRDGRIIGSPVLYVYCHLYFLSGIIRADHFFSRTADQRDRYPQGSGGIRFQNYSHAFPGFY